MAIAPALSLNIPTFAASNSTKQAEFAAILTRINALDQQYAGQALELVSQLNYIGSKLHSFGG